MRKFPAVRSGVVSFVALVSASFAWSSPVHDAPGSSEARSPAAYGALPIAFEPNLGQTGEEVRFLSRGPVYTLYLTQREAVLLLPPPARH